MTTHTLFKSTTKYYRQQLKNILDHRNIIYSQCELRDISKSELITLINRYTTKYNFIKERDSFWYIESIHNNYRTIKI